MTHHIIQSATKQLILKIKFQAWEKWWNCGDSSKSVQ